MLAGSHRNAWPDETGTGGRTNRNTQELLIDVEHSEIEVSPFLFFKGDFKVVDQRRVDFSDKCLKNRKVIEDSNC